MIYFSMATKIKVMVASTLGCMLFTLRWFKEIFFCLNHLKRNCIYSYFQILLFSF